MSDVSGETCKPHWADRLRELLVPVTRHRIERLGIEKSGAYSFYNVRVQAGEIFADYDVALARKLLLCGLDIREVHEIGCGLGQLMFLLGWNGFKTLGFESDRARVRAAKDLLAILKLADPELTENVEVLESEFPLQGMPQPGPYSLVLTTNLVATRSLPQQRAVLQAMLKYPFVVADIQRFFDLRSDSVAEQAALALFAEEGFRKPEMFLDLEQSGRYYLFVNR